MHFAGNASSSAICLKNVEEGGNVISVTADIPPRYMTMQQLNGTRKISPYIRKIVKQVARTRLPFAFNYGIGTTTPNPC